MLRVTAFLLGVILVFTAMNLGQASVDDPPTTKPAAKFILIRQTVFGAQPQQWVFLVKTPSGSVGVTTPEELQRYVALMVPENSILEWTPGCCRSGGEPMDTKKEQDAFAEFCQEYKVKFVHIPSG